MRQSLLKGYAATSSHWCNVTGLASRLVDQRITRQLTKTASDHGKSRTAKFIIMMTDPAHQTGFAKAEHPTNQGLNKDYRIRKLCVHSLARWFFRARISDGLPNGINQVHYPPCKFKSGAATKGIPPSFKLSLLSSPDQPSSVRSFGLEA